MVKNLAELKRYLVEGSKVQMIEYNTKMETIIKNKGVTEEQCKPYMSSITPGYVRAYPFDNRVKSVVKAQTNSVKFDTGSWLDFGKAGDWTFENDLAILSFGNNKLVYRLFN